MRLLHCDECGIEVRSNGATHWLHISELTGTDNLFSFEQRAFEGVDLCSPNCLRQWAYLRSEERLDAAFAGGRLATAQLGVERAQRAVAAAERRLHEARGGES